MVWKIPSSPRRSVVVRQGKEVDAGVHRRGEVRGGPLKRDTRKPAATDRGELEVGEREVVREKRVLHAAVRCR